MSPEQTLSGIVLGARPRKDHYTHWDLFSAAEGIASVTLPQKIASPYGIFDSVELHTTLKGKNYFAKEIVLLERPDALARHPKGFIEAGELGILIQKAFTHMPDYLGVFEIFQKALTYYAQGHAPKAVTLKAFYLMLRAEGFAAKEDWLEHLGQSQQELAKAVLYAPLEAAPKDDEVAPLLRSLTQWASGELGFRM